MSRVLALVLAAWALASPWTARAQGRADARLPAGEFLQRDPEGYADSVNVYAAMANDPVNKRDPTGRKIVFDGAYSADAREQLMRELESISGTSLRICTTQEAGYGQCLDGELLATVVGGEGRFSQTAQNFLMDAIADPSVIAVRSGKSDFNGDPVLFAHTLVPDRLTSPDIGPRTLHNFSDGYVYVDPDDWSPDILSGDEDALMSFSMGLVFMHEILHLAVPFAGEAPYEDPSDVDLRKKPNLKGDVVSWVNIIEEELVLSQRVRFSPSWKRGRNALEFTGRRWIYIDGIKAGQK